MLTFGGCALRTLSADPGLTKEEAIARIVAYEKEYAPEALHAVITADAHSFVHVHRLAGSVSGVANGNVGTTMVGTSLWTANRWAYADLPTFEAGLNWQVSICLFLGSLGLFGPSFCGISTAEPSGFDVAIVSANHLNHTGLLSLPPIWLLGLPGLWWDTDEIEFLEALATMKAR